MDTTTRVALVLVLVGCAGTLLMALARQVVPVLLQGLDQLAPRQVGVTGRLDSLINMFAQQGQEGGYEFVPRPGVTALSRTADSGAITTGAKLATLGASLLLLTGTACYRRAVDQWHIVAPVYPTVGVSSKPISTSQVQVYSCDDIYVNGYTIHVWTEFSFTVPGQAFYSVYDSTGAPVVTRRLLDAPGGAGAFGIRVVASGTAAIVVWNSQLTTIKAAKIDTTNPAAVPTPVVVTALNNQLNFDVQTVGSSGTVAVLYQSSATGRLTQNLITVSSMAVGAFVDYASLTPTGIFCYSTNDFSSNVLFVAHNDSAAGLRVSQFNGATLALNSTSTFDAAATGVFHTIAANRTGGAVSVYYTADPGTGPGQYRIMVSTGAGSTVVLRSLGLASRVVPFGTSLYALARYNPTFTATTADMSYFLIDLTNAVAVGRSAADVAGFEGGSILPNLAQSTASNVFLTAGQVVVGTGSSGGTLFSYIGANAMTFTFQDPTIGKGVELDGCLWLPGSLPMLYDGATLTEAGFPISPPQAAAPTLAGGGALTASSTYTARWTYEWIDSAGNLHQSAPSAPQQFTLGVGQTKATFAIPTLRVTSKTGVYIRFSRTVSNGDGSTYYQEGIVANDPTVDTVSFVSTLADTALVGGEALYTDGGILENLAPPPCKAMAIHRGRILVGGVDGDPTAVWFSKDVVQGFGVAFNDGLVSRLNSGNEPVTAVGSLDTYAVACTATTTWSSGDEYPDDTGNPRVLRFSQTSSTNGCAAASLMARSDDGLTIWQGKKTPGPWQIGRGLSWSWVGSPIQLDAAAMTPATIIAVPGQNQIRVVGNITNFGVSLTRETVFGTWARWNYLKYPTVGAPIFVDAVLWNGNVAYLTADGYVSVEDTTTFGDENTAIAHGIAFSNFNFAGVGGFQRIYNTALTGRVLGSAGDGDQLLLLASQTFDGVPIPDKSLLITPDTDATFGLEIDPGPSGKCSTSTLVISNTTGGLNDPRSPWALSAVTMLVGIKPSLRRVPPSKRMV